MTTSASHQELSYWDACSVSRLWAAAGLSFFVLFLGAALFRPRGYATSGLLASVVIVERVVISGAESEVEAVHAKAVEMPKSLVISSVKGEALPKKAVSEAPSIAVKKQNVSNVASVVASEGASGEAAFPGLSDATDAQVLEEVRPEIPRELRKGKYQSQVRVKVEVDKQGIPSPRLTTTSGNDEIDKRVLEALRQWRWKPATQNGQQMASVRYFKFEFEVR